MPQPTTSCLGSRLTRQRVARIVREAAEEVTRRHESRGLPPLPHITPHSLLRTYISIALLANNFDVKWVMSQVGHADSKMTMDVYAQVEQRADRRHGENFDRLLAGVTGESDAFKPLRRTHVAWDCAIHKESSTDGPMRRRAG